MRAIVALLLAPYFMFAQQPAEPGAVEAAPPALEQRTATTGGLTLPAGTKVVVALKHGLSTRSARPGDTVYAETTFPVVVNDRIVVPPGSYVQGRIAEVKRPGRLKGRAEVLFHFTTLIFPNGYTVSLPGAVDTLPGAERQRVKDQEGTVQQEGEKGRDVGTVARTAGQGAAVGAIAGHGAKGAAIGGGIGAGAGMLVSMLTRGSDMRIEPGATVEMVLQRPLVLDESRMRRH
jgi:type IV secretion system protein VirB10